MAITKIAVVLLVVGLVVGLVAGYGVRFITYQPQISQLQSDLSGTQSSLSETQSALSKSQSEVESLRGQLTEVNDKLTEAQADLKEAEAAIASLETRLSESETNYKNDNNPDCEEFKSDVTSLISSLKKKLDLEKQIIKAFCHVARGEASEAATILFGLGTYVDAVGDAELSAMADEAHTYFNEGKITEAMAKFADLMERNSMLIQSDLSKLDVILAS